MENIKQGNKQKFRERKSKRKSRKIQIKQPAEPKATSMNEVRKCRPIWLARIAENVFNNEFNLWQIQMGKAF